MQFSESAPVLADSAEEAVKLLAIEFLGGYARPRRTALNTKLTTTRKVRQAYRSIGLRASLDVFEKVLVSGRDHNQNFDFAVKNGRIVQLTQAWNFGVSNTAALMEHVKAWAFSVEDILASGAVGKIGSTITKVADDVEILSVYAEPTNSKGRDARDEALHAFAKVGVTATRLKDVGVIAESAYELIN